MSGLACGSPLQALRRSRKLLAHGLFSSLGLECSNHSSNLRLSASNAACAAGQCLKMQPANAVMPRMVPGAPCPCPSSPEHPEQAEKCDKVVGLMVPPEHATVAAAAQACPHGATCRARIAPWLAHCHSPWGRAEEAG